MPKFLVTATVGVSAFAHVEADSAEEAAEKAKSLPVGLESYGADPDEGFVIEDADGEPENIRCTGQLAEDEE